MPVVPSTESVGARDFPGRIGLRLGSGGGWDRIGGPIDFGVGTVNSSGLWFLHYRRRTAGSTWTWCHWHGACCHWHRACTYSIIGCTGAIGMGGPTGGPINIGRCDIPAAAIIISCWFCICCCCGIIRLLCSTNSSSCNNSRTLGGPWQGTATPVDRRQT